MKHILVLAAALAAGISSAQPADFPGSTWRYTFIDLPTVSPYVRSEAGGINDYKHVARTDFKSDNTPRAHYFNENLNSGVPIALSEAGATNTHANDIASYDEENSGEHANTVHDEYVVGSGIVEDVRQPVFWVRLHGQPGFGSSFAVPHVTFRWGWFNRADPYVFDYEAKAWRMLAVGRANETETSPPIPIYWQPGLDNSQPLPLPQGYTTGEAYSCNAKAYVVGYIATSTSGLKLPCIWKPSGFYANGNVAGWSITLLNGWPGNTSGWAYDIKSYELSQNGSSITIIAGTKEGTAQAFTWDENESAGTFFFHNYSVQGVRAVDKYTMLSNLDSQATSYFIVNQFLTEGQGRLGKFYNDVDGLRAHAKNGELSSRMQILYDTAIQPGTELTYPYLLMRSDPTSPRLAIGYQVSRPALIPTTDSDFQITRGLYGIPFNYSIWADSLMFYDNLYFPIGKVHSSPPTPNVQFDFSADFTVDGDQAFTATVSARLNTGTTCDLWMEVWDYVNEVWEDFDIPHDQEKIKNNWKSFRLAVPYEARFFGKEGTTHHPQIRVNIKDTVANLTFWSVQVDHLRFDLTGGS